MKRKIETSLLRAVEQLPQPDYELVVKAPVQRMEVHDYVTRQEVALFRRTSRRWIPAVALALCALVLCGGMAIYVQFFQVYSVVDLRVNPAFAIELNRRDQVCSVQPLTDDAKPILEGRSYRGWSLDAVVGALVDELTTKGYLDTSDDRVDVAVNSKSASHGRELREQVESVLTSRISALPSPAVTPPSPAPSQSLPPQTNPNPPATGQTTASPFTVPDWMSLPLDRNGVEQLLLSWVPDAVVQELKLDNDDGIWYYEIKYWNGAGDKYEMDINAQTGEVLKWELD